MAKALLLSAKQNPSATELTALYPQDKALQELYYKIVVNWTSPDKQPVSPIF